MDAAGITAGNAAETGKKCFSAETAQQKIPIIV
jgi:hypothetical protein